MEQNQNTCGGSCCQGHSHQHHHGQGCGHSHCGCHGPKVELTCQETAFIDRLAENGPLPVARFVMQSTKSEHFSATAMDPVFLENEEDDMKTVRAWADLLEKLEEYTLVEIDYDTLLEESLYTLYEHSAVYAYFLETIEEAKANPEFLFDTAFLEKGSVRLTEMGAQVAQKND